MAITKEKKENIVKNIKENLEKQKILLLVGIAGLKAKDMLDLRTELKENNCLLNVVKKTLLKIALDDKKLQIEDKNMEGEVALIFGFKDEISAAKTANQFSQSNEALKILGGIFENQFINKEKVVELAQIPSREELLAKLVGSIKAPVAGFVNVLEGNIKSLIYVLSNIKNN